MLFCNLFFIVEGEVVFLVENKVILTIKPLIPDAPIINVLTFYNKEGSNSILYYNCLGGHGNLLVRTYANNQSRLGRYVTDSSASILTSTSIWALCLMYFMHQFVL